MKLSKIFKLMLERVGLTIPVDEEREEEGGVDGGEAGWGFQVGD